MARACSPIVIKIRSSRVSPATPSHERVTEAPRTKRRPQSHYNNPAAALVIFFRSFFFVLPGACYYRHPRCRLRRISCSLVLPRIAHDITRDARRVLVRELYKAVPNTRPSFGVIKMVTDYDDDDDGRGVARELVESFPIEESGRRANRNGNTDGQRKRIDRSVLS